MKPATRVTPGAPRGLFVVALLGLGALSTTGLAEEVVLHEGPFASSGGQSFKNVVRSADGALYCVSILETEDLETGDGERRIVVQVSADDGASWETMPFVFNDEASGLVTPEPANGCAVAIDDRGVLHVTWGRYYYPSSYRQYYRNWDPARDVASAVFDISAWSGAALTARTAAMDIAIDGDNTVWFVAHAPRSWVEHLAHSTAPYAEDLQFVDAGAISPSASAQTTRLAIDTAGRVHCAFYRNIGAGQFEHRVFDPATGWGESTNLGNTTPQNDIWGVLATDGLGHAHVLFIEDGTDNSPLWRFLYRRWSEDAGWGDAVTLVEIEPEQRTDIANTHVIALGCDESTGDVVVFYRDLSRGGALGVVEKSLDAPAFGEFVEIAPPTTTLHAYYTPALRGRLYPEFDRTSHGLHATWQHRPTGREPPYALRFAALGGAEPGPVLFRRGEVDDAGALNLTDAVYLLSSLFIGGPPPGCLAAADADDTGDLNLTDPIYLLNFLFLGGPAPSAPFASCGLDPTPDILPCASFTNCGDE